MIIIWKKKLDWILSCFYSGNINKLQNALRYILWYGIYHIIIKNDSKEYALVDSLVEFTKTEIRTETSRLVNAILRSIIRNKSDIPLPDEKKDKVHSLAIQYSHPEWMVKRWLSEYGEENTRKILKKNNSIPNLFVRINISKVKPLEIEKFLEERKINFKKFDEVPNFLLIENKFPVSESEIFRKGFISIQDMSSGIAVSLLDLETIESVVDVCSAPGSKSLQLAELTNDKVNIFSVDINLNRIKLVLSGKKRLEIENVFTVVADGRALPFREIKNIILDVPCSNLGNLNKRADLRWKITEQDISDLIKLQKELLMKSSELLKKGGFLVYSTCTIEKTENEEIIEWFLKQNTNFVIAEPLPFKDSNLKNEKKYVKSVQGINEFINGSFSVLMKKVK